MLRAIRKGRSFSNFKVLENDVEVAEFNFKFASKKMNVEIQGVAYEFEARETNFSGGNYVIESNNSILAVAERPGIFGKTFSFVLGERQYQLGPEQGWMPRFILLEGEQQVGRIYSEKGQIIAELPTDLSLPVRVFMCKNQDLTVQMKVFSQDLTVKVRMLSDRNECPTHFL